MYVWAPIKLSSPRWGCNPNMKFGSRTRRTKVCKHFFNQRNINSLNHLLLNNDISSKHKIIGTKETDFFHLNFTLQIPWQGSFPYYWLLGQENLPSICCIYSCSVWPPHPWRLSTSWAKSIRNIIEPYLTCVCVCISVVFLLILRPTKYPSIAYSSAFFWFLLIFQSVVVLRSL